MTGANLETIYEFDVSGGRVVYGGQKLDPFDIVDALHGSDSKIYLHDLDSRLKGRPQLDLVQDMSLEMTIWYDGGIRQAEGVIDPLVAGAAMVALDPAYMKSMPEYEHVMKLTNNVILDILSEHEDRIPDYNKHLITAGGIRTLISTGYQNFLIGQDELVSFDQQTAEQKINVWVRTGQSRERITGLPQCVELKGNVMSIAELVTDDER